MGTAIEKSGIRKINISSKNRSAFVSLSIRRDQYFVRSKNGISICLFNVKYVYRKIENRFYIRSITNNIISVLHSLRSTVPRRYYILKLDLLNAFQVMHM